MIGLRTVLCNWNSLSEIAYACSVCCVAFAYRSVSGKLAIHDIDMRYDWDHTSQVVINVTRSFSLYKSCQVIMLLLYTVADTMKSAATIAISKWSRTSFAWHAPFPDRHHDARRFDHSDESLMSCNNAITPYTLYVSLSTLRSVYAGAVLLSTFVTIYSVVANLLDTAHQRKFQLLGHIILQDVKPSLGKVNDILKRCNKDPRRVVMLTEENNSMVSGDSSLLSRWSVSVEQSAAGNEDDITDTQTVL